MMLFACTIQRQMKIGSSYAAKQFKLAVFSSQLNAIA